MMYRLGDTRTAKNISKQQHNKKRTKKLEMYRSHGNDAKKLNRSEKKISRRS